METRVCNICKEDKELSRFSPGKYSCKDCRNKKRRGAKQKFEPQWGKIKKCYTCKEEKIGTLFSSCKESGDGLKGTCKECDGFKNKKRLLGVDRKEYNKMLHEQKGKCKICKGTDVMNRNNDKFHIDHCHTTGKVRGLLCDACNRALGFFKDNKDAIKVAYDYINNEGDI